MDTKSPAERGTLAVPASVAAIRPAMVGVPPAAQGALAVPMPCTVPRQLAVRLNRALADGVFAALLLTVLLLAGWLAARHDRTWDLTSGERHSLSAESLAVLGGLTEPLRITIYGPPAGPLARTIEQVLLPYRRARPDLAVDYIDPALFPEQARAADVRVLGQLVLEYQGRQETLGVLGERALTNAIARLQLTDPPRVVVAEGHGERGITGAAGTGLGRFAQLLHQRGFLLQPLDLTRHPAIPANTDLLLLSMPAIPLFPAAVGALVNYVAGGGNLLWLLDPVADGTQGAMSLLGQEPLAAALGIEVLPGQVVDAAAAGVGFDMPTVAVVKHWPAHLVTDGLGEASDLPGLFPGSLALRPGAGPDWRLEATLTTGAQSWNETGPITGEIARDEAEGEQAGPLTVALILTRPLPGTQPAGPADAPGAPAHREQRAIVVGDGDFLSSARLESGANLALGLRMARWLSGREDLVRIPAPPSDREPLLLDPTRGIAIAAWSLGVLPLLFALMGLLVHWRRGRAG